MSFLTVIRVEWPLNDPATDDKDSARGAEGPLAELQYRVETSGP